MENSSKIIILRGNSGSGKTTVANALQKKLGRGTLIISPKPNCNDFGKNDMKLWWNEKDFIGIFEEKRLTKELSIDETVDIIMKDINSSL